MAALRCTQDDFDNANMFLSVIFFSVMCMVRRLAAVDVHMGQVPRVSRECGAVRRWCVCAAGIMCGCCRDPFARSQFMSGFNFAPVFTNRLPVFHKQVRALCVHLASPVRARWFCAASPADV